MNHGRCGATLLTFALCAAGGVPAPAVAAAGVAPAAAAPAQRVRGYGRRRRRGGVRRVLRAPYKAVKASGKATGRAVKASGRAVGRTFRRAFGTRHRKRY